jgi:hypothetical protein
MMGNPGETEQSPSSQPASPYAIYIQLNNSYYLRTTGKDKKGIEY